MILLDFSKAFDTVPHCRLLKKLKFYHIENQVIQLIEKWLTLRKQHVLLDGESSDWLKLSLCHQLVCFRQSWGVTRYVMILL